jgi:HD superfamily phosphohydrolase
MSDKIFRDPLYNYISIDRQSDGWLIELLDSREVQRLRRIHQLGVSNFTYPGAEHSRLSHSLGVLHLMQVACEHLKRTYPDAQVTNARPTLLAAAVLHDVGHGPFSHVFEPCLGIDHEDWSRNIVLAEDSECHAALAKVDRFLPQKVAALIDPDNHEDPAWMKYLLSSQLDVDRLEYLRRVSFFSGAGYGHYDWFRILSSFELHDFEDTDRTLVWPRKSIIAVEEYVFARYYMYQSVYLHKTTRGFEQMLIAMWRRARSLNKRDAGLVPALKQFWAGKTPTIQQYLAIEEFTVLQQIQAWTQHSDQALSDLASRFLARRRFICVEPPAVMLQAAEVDFSREKLDYWHDALCREVSDQGFDPEMYCLRDEVKPKYHQPYFPEKEGDEQSAKNAIRIIDAPGSPPIEISQLCPRLQPVTQKQRGVLRHYVPNELRGNVTRLRAHWQSAQG